MIVTSTSRASSAWLMTCPKRPKPMISTLPLCPATSSTPSSDGFAFGSRRRTAISTSGVSTIESTTTAVRFALNSAPMTPALAAAANSTNANSPPWAISTARSSASRWLVRRSLATT